MLTWQSFSVTFRLSLSLCLCEPSTFLTVLKILIRQNPRYSARPHLITLALTNTTRAITHPTLIVPRSAIYSHHSVTYATTAAVSFLSVAMLSVALVELALVEVQTQPTGPDEDQMQPGSVPCSSGASAARRPAVVILKTMQLKYPVCMCRHKHTRCSGFLSENSFFFSSLVLHSGGHNFRPLSISTPSLLCFSRLCGKKVGSALASAAVKDIIWVHSRENFHSVGSFNTNIGGNNLPDSYPRCHLRTFLLLASTICKHTHEHTQRIYHSGGWIHPSVDGVTCCVASLVPQPLYNFMPPTQGLVNSTAGTGLRRHESKW